MNNFDICRCMKCGLQLESMSGKPIPAVPVCCGEPMSIQQENSVDAAKEKHVPTVEALPDGGIMVKVGEVAHPMTPEHYIEWIEVVNGSYVNRYHLKPGDLPQAVFYVPLSPKLIIRESCNIHGVWKKP